MAELPTGWPTSLFFLLDCEQAPGGDFDRAAGDVELLGCLACVQRQHFVLRFNEIDVPDVKVQAERRGLEFPVADRVVDPVTDKTEREVAGDDSWRSFSFSAPSGLLEISLTPGIIGPRRGDIAAEAPVAFIGIVFPLKRTQV